MGGDAGMVSEERDISGWESKLGGEGGYDIRIFNPDCFVVDAFEIKY